MDGMTMIPYDFLAWRKVSNNSKTV